MGSLLYINEGRRRIAAKKVLTPWLRRFGIAFDENTSIRKLDHRVIKYLVVGGEDSSAALYELIMGIKGLGQAPSFPFLDSESKMEVTDITLFLLDLVRFEAMYRLGWLDDYPFLEVSLVDLVQSFQDKFSVAGNNAPALSAAHPLYEKYAAEFEGDRNSFVRKLIPEAIKTFCDATVSSEE
ncbi:conserved hypothetical protein [Syntrophobacter sp. SbD1]|nr:conserved hypothetical protein [Syntrophobacter sp. SbD1]